jgi:DNA-binding transcriptional regulator YiaG
MRKTWTELKNETMTQEAQQVAHSMAMKELAEMELADLREDLHIRRNDLARKIKVTEAAISQLERRPNVLLSAIANYVEALDGKLEVRAVLPDRTIELTHLLAPSRVAAKKAGKNSRSPVARKKARRKK